MMSITDDQVAALRAQLEGQHEEHERLRARVNEGTNRSSYGALLAGAFFEAVNRRFDKNTPDSEVMDFVASVRSSSEEVASKIDPVSAERLIRSMYTSESVDDLDGKALGRMQALLLIALVADEQMDSSGLDSFMAKARALGEHMIGG